MAQRFRNPFSLLFLVLLWSVSASWPAAFATTQGWRPVVAQAPYDLVSWASRPGGLGIAYVIESVDRTKSWLLYQDVASRNLMEVVGSPAGTAHPDYLPTWSPDGSMLAYFASVRQHSELRLWRPLSKTDVVIADNVCTQRNESGCYYGQIQWSPDSKRIYFLGRPPQIGGFLKQGAEDHRHDPPWRSLLFSDSANQGITVRTSLGMRSPAEVADGTPADVMVADIATKRVQPIFVCGNATTLATSPDGRHLLIVAMVARSTVVPQQFDSFFVVPTSGRPPAPFAEEASAGKCERKSIGMRPLLKRAAMSFKPVAWSPDSRSIGFIARGPLGKGDIYEINAVTGILTNLTAGPLSRESGETDESVPAENRDFATPGAKFNDSDLEWSPQGEHIFATRRTLVNGLWLTRLWEMSPKRPPINLTGGSSFDASNPIFPDETDMPRGDFIVPIEERTGQAGFVKYSHLSSTPERRLSISGGFVDLRSALGRVEFSVQRGTVSFVSESATNPPEAFTLDLQRLKIIQRTFVNADIKRANLPEVRRITWVGRDHEIQYGYLYLPPKSSPRTPVVVQVYPRYDYQKDFSGEWFVGSPDLFLSPLRDLLGAGYAVFKPDLTVSSHENACETVAGDIARSLDAVAKLRLADVSRAALIGHSFGGWAVECTISYDHRFRAAVSVAGIADWIGMTVSPVDAATRISIGGGQAEIGGSPWTHTAAFWRESPVSGAPEITTPLLLLHGKLDNTVPVEQSAEMFMALSHFAKSSTLVTYDGIGHGSILDLPDYKRRVIAWIQNHLEPNTTSKHVGVAPIAH